MTRAAKTSKKSKARKVRVVKVTQIEPEVQSIELEVHGAPPLPENEPVPTELIDLEPTKSAGFEKMGWRAWLRSLW